MVFRYPCKIWSFDSDREIRIARAASLSLRVRLRWEVRYVCFTYCCVIVDAPCRLPEPVTSDRAARTMLTGLRAPSEKKCRSSVETTASTTIGGTCPSDTLTRFCSEKEASTWPDES